MKIVLGLGKYLLKNNDTIRIYKECFEILDKKGNRVYYESLFGGWIKTTFDINGEISYINDTGYWRKSLYNSNSNLIYLEDSINGVTVDKRKKEMTIEEVEELLGFAIKIVK